MKSVLIYTFHTYPHIKKLEQLGSEIFVLGQNLRESIIQLEKRIDQEDYYLLIGIADNKKITKIESRAVNIFNNGKVLPNAPEEYPLSCPSKRERKELIQFKKNGLYTTSFCNYAAYRIQHFISSNSVDIDHMFIHLNYRDMPVLRNYLCERDRKPSPLSMVKKANAWYKAYNIMQPESAEDTHLWLVSVYCLIQALELYMKAYIIFKNPKYLYGRLLQDKFQHNISKMIGEIGFYGPKELHRKLLVIYNRDLPLDENGNVKNFTDLRYGKTGDLTTFVNIKSLKKYSQRFEKVFDFIDSKINKNFSKYYDKHLKRDQKI